MPAAMASSRPFIEQAFAREHVTIDYAGFSGETLHGVMHEPLDKIRIGRIRPASVTIRMLLPDTTKPMVLPCRAEDLADDPDYRDRMTRLTSRPAHAIIDTVQEASILIEANNSMIMSLTCAATMERATGIEPA